MFKLYLPAGNLEEPTANLLKEAGLRIAISHRNETAKVENIDLPMKMIRPQDMPTLLALGKGDLAITSSEILREFLLSNPSSSGKIAAVLELGLVKTKLVIAVSKEVFPLTTTFAEFMTQVRKQGKTQVIVATEYPATIKNYLSKKGISSAKIYVPYGMTENWILPPNPEADLIGEVVAADKNLEENNCQIIEVVQENQAIILASRVALEDAAKRQRIDDLVVNIRRALYKIKEREERLRQAQLPLPELKAKPIPAY